MKSFIQASSSLLFVFVLILGRIAGAESSPPEIRTPATILFIGDSFTGYKGGIYTHVEKLASAAMPTPASLKTEAVVVGGAPLKRLWELKDAAKAINTGKFDVVVFQDDIPEINVDYFRQYARLFIEEARKNRATPVLYMTWAYKRLGWISMREIAAAHRTLADELHIEVAPVGLAWEEACRQQPGLDLYAKDREHPNVLGMYLASCVVYATIYHIDPTGFNYVPSGVPSDEALFLQKVAWKAVQDWSAGNSGTDSEEDAKHTNVRK